MNTKKSTTTVETSDKSDNKTNRNSFTQEISKDIKTVVASVKKNNPKMAGILSLVAAGIWVFCLLLGALVPITVAGLSVVSFVLLICVTILVVIAWKKSSSSKTKGFKKQELTKKFLLIAFIACVISLVIGIFAMPAAYLAWSHVAILILDIIFGLTGIAFIVAAVVLLFRTQLLQTIASKDTSK